MKKVLILTSEKEFLKEFKLDNVDVRIADIVPDRTDDTDLIVLYRFTSHVDKLLKGNSVIRCHESLLPSFNTDTPIKDAFISGVKVTGVTVHWVENNDLTGKIIAQYPVIIDNYTHYEQLVSEIENLSKRLLPIVIKSIVTDTVFDIVDLLYENKPNSCGNGCGSCKNCHKQ